MESRQVSQAQAGVAGAYEVEQLVAVLAHERLDVVARHVVPLDAVVIEVVQDRQARLVVTLPESNHSYNCIPNQSVVFASVVG